MAELTTTAKRIITNVERVIVGKRQQIILALVAWFCEGHILLEDVPGVAKTMLARALAGSVGCTFRRMQCTPDLLSSDITGVSFTTAGSPEQPAAPMSAAMSATSTNIGRVTRFRVRAEIGKTNGLPTLTALAPECEHRSCSR